MKLKQLQLNGFKSFSDKTKITFPIGVSAIVGPNGCGKSNILDALRWVMGEQSSKQLRGKAMEDVIFAGTDGRAPSNLAEVSLVLSNDDKGSCPEEYKNVSEIVITRRLTRNGDSSYFINKKSGRLRDIQNILMSSGMGARAYSIVQQNNVGAITEAGPDERRTFIEEAAGITKYKLQKKETLRKMDHTNQNLLRVKDIVNEVEKQMRGLKRQANKAEQYQNLQNRIFKLDVSCALLNSDNLEKKINETKDLLNRLKDQDVAQITRLKELHDAIEKIQTERMKKDNIISEQKARRFDTQRRIDKIENDLSHANDEVKRLTDELRDLEKTQIEIEEKNQNMSSEIQRLRQDAEDLNNEANELKSQYQDEEAERDATLSELENLNNKLNIKKASLMDYLAQEARYKNVQKNASQNKESLEIRIKRTSEEKIIAQNKVDENNKQLEKLEHHIQLLKERIEELELLVSDLRDQLDEKRNKLSQQIKKVQNFDINRSKIKSKYHTLKKMDDNLTWYKDGVKTIMARKRKDPGIIDILADIIQPYPLYEEAIEAALGEMLQYIIVKDHETGTNSANYLKEENAGRSGFIPLKELIQKDCDKGDFENNKLLINYMTIKPEYEKMIYSLLGNVLYAYDLNEALSMWNKNKGFSVVTQKGELITSKGILIGGSKSEGIIAKKLEIKQLKEQLDTLEDELIAAKLAQQELENQTRDIEKDLQQYSQSLNTFRQNEIEAEKNIYKATEDLKHSNRNLEFISGEIKRLENEENEVKQELTESDEALKNISKDISNAQADITQVSKHIKETSNTLEDHQQRVVDLKLKATSIQTQLENSTNTLRRIKDFQNDSQSNLEKIKQSITQKSLKISACKKQIIELEEDLKVRKNELLELNNALSDNQDEFSEIAKQIKENDDTIKKIKDSRDDTQEKIRSLELEQSQRQLKLENIQSRIKERYDIELTEIDDSFEKETELSKENMEQELSECRKKISKIGAVNMDAIKEYEELDERFQFLDKEHNDLVTAMTDLDKVIKKINKISKERFVDTFNKINEKLNEVFPQLFQGGKANLVMTEPDKPLETGVEFMVHPPGKRLTRLSLLSGGEKALSAIAFIFSIFLIKPASFCIMDEIDAPLDEANVSRFNSLLKIIGEKSQIIIVTHNKGSMEFADMLFGVTMEEKGVSKIVSVNLTTSN